jgi:hypothetical protein
MLAYIFWHRPHGHVDAATYEEAVLRFQSDLSAQSPPGLIAATSFRIDAAPWLADRPGYEDWYLMEGSWAMDPLNAFAVAGRTRSTHDAAAAQAEDGHGGLYTHEAGELAWNAQSTLCWFNRPRGIHWQSALEPVRAARPQAVIWRRQMVLAPAPEFAVELPDDGAIEAPAGWQQVCRVRRTRLGG